MGHLGLGRPNNTHLEGLARARRTSNIRLEPLMFVARFAHSYNFIVTPEPCAPEVEKCCC